MRVVLYTGKGGVGKTTTAAATAVWAAARGLRVLVASADAAHSLGDVLKEPLGAEPRRLALAESGTLSGVLAAVEVDARAEVARHWGAVGDYLGQLFRHQGIEEVMADELALLPGLEELTTLLAVDSWASGGAYDLVVVDCAPTDSALRLLTLPEAAHAALRILLKLQRAITAMVTPLARNLVAVPLPGPEVFRDAEALIYRQLGRLRERISDPGTSVRLVLTPERMVIDESLRARTDLALFDVAVDAVVMNRLLPEEAAAEPFFAEWVRQQAARRSEVAGLFSPLPILEAPLQHDEVTSLERLRAHGRDLFGDQAPEALLSTEPGLEFKREDPGYLLRLPLPNARAEDLDVSRIGAQLVVRTGALRRPIPLPRHLLGLDVSGARCRDGILEVHFQSIGDA
ncbi:MAG: TRC40/GET3/ArsA family transport-energizing ATPase [bacterium]|nr:TRC40/GET3/ArsA family transport-energizing ATPase [bacterium]